MQQERDDRSGGVAQTPFAQYLRFGRVRRTVDAIEVKFNPYHDPRNGRFTFGPGGPASAADKPRMPSRLGPGGVRPQSAGSKAPPQRPGRSSAPLSVSRPTADGSWRGGGFTGGGGGSFGGGGAQPRPRAAVISAEPLHEEVRGPYRFQIDSQHRTRFVDGSLKLGPPEPRSPSTQLAAGGSDRLPTDEGGHYIANRFAGPSDAFNTFAQDQNLNRSAYARLENKWAANIKAGRKVRVHIEPRYSDSSRRPFAIMIVYFIDNRRFSEILPNAKGAGK